MLQDLLRNRKATGLVIIGLAALAYYRYSKMTTEEKNDLVDTITNTGKSLLGQFMKNNPKSETANAGDDYQDAVVV